MSVEEFITLLQVELKDDVIGAIIRKENVITVTFTDGTVRTIAVS